MFGCLLAAPKPSHAQQSTEILPLDQIHAGMQGYAYTIFAGDQIEKFDLEVLGVMPNFMGPRQSIILVQLKGPKVEHTGVVAGMSGSENVQTFACRNLVVKHHLVGIGLPGQYHERTGTQRC